MSKTFYLSIVRPLSIDGVRPTIAPTKLDRRPRVGGHGPNFETKQCKEINEICDTLHMTGIEICNLLADFDSEHGLTRQGLQSYKQGYVREPELYEALLGRMRPFLHDQLKKHGHLINSEPIDIYVGWLKLLKIDISDKKNSAWRLFSDKIGVVKKDGKDFKIDPTTVYRWFQGNKRPSSNTELIWYDNLVKATAKKLN